MENQKEYLPLPSPHNFHKQKPPKEFSLGGIILPRNCSIYYFSAIAACEVRYFWRVVRKNLF